MRTINTFIAAAAVIGAVGRTDALQAQGTAKADEGKKLYDAQKCATCHKIKGEGKLFALDGIAAKLSADDLKKWLTNTAEMEAKLPKKPPVSMAGYMKTRKLTPAEIDALVAYMLTLK
jgi:mono/diheme cytochrome c family protein